MAAKLLQYTLDANNGIQTTGYIDVPRTITLGTEQASTSGTSIDFTGIPTGVKRITVMLKGVSTNGTSVLLLQLGDSGGIETSGYIGTGETSGAAAVSSTAGLPLTGSSGATAIVSGIITLCLENSAAFSWISSGLTKMETNDLGMCAGEKATSAELDRIRLTTVNGTDAFDAGLINISYE